MAGLFNKFKQGLSKTREGFVGKISQLVAGKREFDDDFFEELEEILIQGDVGVESTMQLVERLREEVKSRQIKETEELHLVLEELVLELLGEGAALNLADAPTVIMVVGVNGAGKTTTIGKLAYQLRGEGKKVLIAAGDTFRAAAIEQLEVWANRVECPVIKHQAGSDPAAVAYDAVHAARSRGYDVVIVDTAGRLQNKTNLMNELQKVYRVIAKDLADAPQEVLLVLDATTGQNAISQAKIFKEAVGVTGIALTKLDGTAKGGVVLSVANELGIPVKLVGIGEGMEDLRPFQPELFAKALFGREEVRE
ncbi:signal recognition particle-docking protein FtsY [Metallumcola ferriviriculae]|uniref:Signal recognition particle receptor FtsY n=1 Tax=Metallumcola ferriviriculae TaxID=3039180 RepID=A0AAU0ULH6_9FIRM|nr:signal recognition particle-docking protein FtsY [Desulfitibacteraceae bacterium MK1]